MRFTSQSDRGLEIGREDRCCPEIARHGLAHVNASAKIESFVISTSGLTELDERRFAVSALVTLKPVLIDAGSGRFDAGNHHLTSTLWTVRPVDGWKPKKNKLGMEHGLLV